MKKTFKIDNKNFKVDIKENLLKFLTPTTPGTKYYDSPPERAINKFEKGRILLQVNQFLYLMNSIGYNLKNKSLLDVGTGNGTVPRLILNFTNLRKCDGTDPFYDGEHTTSWQKHDRDKLYLNLSKYLNNQIEFNISDYLSRLSLEDFSMRPGNVKLTRNKKQKKMKFYSYGATSLHKLKKKYDVIYCKAIEHISNLSDIVRSFKLASKKNSIVYFKHRSFFSYLGPHRYSSTGIPWGHVLMNNAEYKKYVSKFHNERKKKMIDFYYSGISYPRFTVNDIIEEFLKNGYQMILKINENGRFNNEKSKKSKLILDNWKIVKKRHPNLSLEEILSGIYHLVFKKND